MPDCADFVRDMRLMIGAGAHKAPLRVIEAGENDILPPRVLFFIGKHFRQNFSGLAA